MRCVEISEWTLEVNRRGHSVIKVGISMQQNCRGMRGEDTDVSSWVSPQEIISSCPCKYAGAGAVVVYAPGKNWRKEK